MQRLSYQQVFLDRQADQIERALSSLALPAKVYGGSIGEDRIRYRLTPVSGTQPQAVAQVAEEVADALGVAQISVARDPQGLAIDIPVSQGPVLRLLPLLHSMQDLTPLMVVLGMSEAGMPLAFYLTQLQTWHCLVLGASGCGKSELLRTTLLSLALTSRRSEVQFLGVDLSGRELTLIEALPHNLAEVAAAPEYATDLLLWLAEEIDRRQTYRIQQPHMVMFIDDLDWIGEMGSEPVRALKRIIQDGPSTGVHLIAAARDNCPAVVRHAFTGPGVIKVQPIAGVDQQPGRFQLAAGRETATFEAAWLTLRDLDTAVRLAQSGWRANSMTPLMEVE